MRVSTRVIAGLFLLAAAPTVSAQTDVFPNLWITDARVEGMAILGDTVFVGGRFDYVGPPTGQLAVLDRTTGEADLSQPRFSALGTSGILVTLPDGAGGYYVGGAFSAVAGQSRRNLAHVLPNGTLDQNFRPDPTKNESLGVVTSLALGDGRLYVGGDFDIVAGQPRQDLAVLDAASGDLLPLQASFAYPSTTSYEPSIQTMLLHDGTLYVGGIFQVVSGKNRTGLVALDASSGAVLPWQANLTDENPNFLAYPNALALGDETLYLGSGYDFVNEQRRDGLAEVTLADPETGEGGVLTSWSPTLGLPDPINAQDLVVIGNFVYSAGSGLLKTNRSTAAIQSIPLGVSDVRRLAYDPTSEPSGQGVLYVGALRSTNGSGGDRYPVVVGVDPATGQPTGFDVQGASEDDVVASLTVEPGASGRLFVGGDFVTLGAGIARRNGLAAFDLTTGRPTDFGAGNFPFTEDLALAPDSRFLYGFSDTAGGLRLTEFDLASGATREFIPRGQRPEPKAMTAPPSARRPLAPNPRVENAASALVVTDDGAGSGRVCVSSRGVACYDRASADLLFYTPMPSVTGQGENNGDLLYLPPGGPVAGPGGAEGTLYVAAPIEEAPVGTRRPAFVAVDYATGTVLPSWDVGFGPTGGPEGYTLALLDRDGADGPTPATLYLGGDRQWTVQGQTRRELMAVDPTTAALQPWAPVVSGGAVFTMAAQRSPGGQGVVYVGGAFRFVNGTIIPTSAVAFDAETGAYLPGWTPGTGIAFVSLVSEQHDAVFVGGLVGLPGSGHEHLVAVTPARPILPTAGEASGPDVPREASLSLAGPNPLRSRTALSLSLPEAQSVQASLFDVLGRRVAVLHTGALPAGVSRIEIDASALPAGVYVARVVAGAFTEALRLTVVR